MASTDFELGSAVAEYQKASNHDQRVSSLKKVASQVKHKALAESTAISIIGLVTEAVSFGPEVKDAALTLLAYLIRRIHSQGQFQSSMVTVALNTIPNWPDTLTALRKRGVPAEIRLELQEALERPPSLSSTYGGLDTIGTGPARPPSRPGAERRHVTHSITSQPASADSGAGKGQPIGYTLPDNGLDPFHVSSASQLDHLCRDMLPDFEGKESEGNWPKRDKHILKLRQITKGNAPTDFTAAYMGNWKVLLDGIIKCATSLRTTFSTNGCMLIQEAAFAVGHGLDPYSGRLLEITIKMCSDTKPIAQQNGNNCVLALISNVSWNRHIMQHIFDACGEKNAKPREYAYGWLQTVLGVYNQRKSVLEQANGLDMLEKCFRKGLADPNPKVRETAKKVFWEFHTVWPMRGNAIISSLDERAQKSINAANPRAATNSTPAIVPSIAAPTKARVLNNRPSIKDIMAAKRREKAVDRPQSALASFPSLDHKPAKKPTVPPALAQHAAREPTTGGLSSAPVRPGRKVISRQVSRPDGLASSMDMPERPKTPFHTGAAKRAESSAEEKHADGPRRPAAPTGKAAPATRPAVIKKQTAPSSLPTSPETSCGSSKVSRPKSISENTPPPAFPRAATMIELPKMGTPILDRTIKRNESPLHSHPSPSRTSTPARVYEDPRSSPSISSQNESTDNIPSFFVRNIPNGAENTSSSINVTPSTKLLPQGDATITVSNGESFSPVKMPLAELSANGVNTPLSADKRDPRSAQLIDSGISHMKSGRLDPHGYRKLIDAVRQSLDTLPSPKYNELLTTLLNVPAAGQENANGSSNLTGSSERILVQRLHLLSTLGKSPQIQPHMSTVLRLLIHILRCDARPDSHTYWVAEGQLKEFASITCSSPNTVIRSVILDQPANLLYDPIVLKCAALLAQNRKFESQDDHELIERLADLAGQAMTRENDVDARITGHQLAQALGPHAVRRYLGEEKGGVAFLLYQNMKTSV